MAEIKKAQAAGFAEDSNAFAGGSSVKGTAAPKKAQQKQSGVHQPRDADDTSGQNVQRSGQAETFGQDVQKQTKTSDSRKAKGGQRKQHRKQGAFGQSDKMFFGSGTTGLVAVRNDRHYIGIELNEEYCVLAGERIGGGYENKAD